MSNDHPSPWSTPGHQQGWPPQQPSYAPEPSPPPTPAPSSFVAQAAGAPLEVRLLSQPGASRGLATAGVVLGGVALLAALLALLVAVFGFAAGGDPGGPYGIRGTLAPVKGGLSGPALADEVTRKITEDGGEPADLSCPKAVTVAQDVTAVCHGSDFGDPATFVVFFEDDRGAYTLLEV